MIVDAVRMQDERVLLRYRNREVRDADLRFLRGVIARNDGGRRGDIVQDVCAAWDWRQANGALAVMGCTDLLLRLEERGHLRLPPLPTVKHPERRLPLLPTDLVPLAWLDVRDPGVDLAAIEVRPIEPEERLGWRIVMDRFHYLGWKAGVGERVEYAATIGGELVGLLGWASAALHVPARDRRIGWDEATKRRRLRFVVNNVRFLVPPWVRVNNLASRVLALNLRRLSADWQRAWGHPVYMAETFVDSSRFRGTCYRAANWVHLGMTAGRSKRGNQYRRGSVPKAVFVYDLRRNAGTLLRGPG
jgi:hypothetical protein